MKLERPDSLEGYLRRYPRICAHIIAESLGYATPINAAAILKDAKEGKENWCDWIYSCYNRRPEVAVQQAVTNRRRHEGYMASYPLALRIVRRAIDTGKEPLLAYRLCSLSAGLVPPAPRKPGQS